MAQLVREISDHTDTTERHHTEWVNIQVDSALSQDLFCGNEQERNLTDVDGIQGDGVQTDWVGESMAGQVSPIPCDHGTRGYICEEDIDGDYTVEWVESINNDGDDIFAEASYNDGGPDISFSFDTAPSGAEDIYFKWIPCDDGFQSNKQSFRFPNITIPSGATIDSAYLQLKASANSNDAISVKIKGEDVSNATKITSGGDFDGRSRTTAAIDWDVGAGTSWSDGTYYNSPDIKSIIDEIMSNGWTSGNAIQLFIEDDGTAGDNFREIYMYTAAQPHPPKLELNYTESGGNGTGIFTFQLLQHGVMTGAAIGD